MSTAPRPAGAGSSRRWRPRALSILFVLLLVMPIVEIAVIVLVGQAIGGWQTVALLLVESALGAWLVRREGARAWHALSTALSTGRMPSRELSDAALVLVGGTLLLTPGFVTDVVGFFFVLPVTRPLARRALEAVVARRLLGGVFVTATTSRAGWSTGSPATGPGRSAPRHGGARAEGGRPSDPDVIEGEVL